MNILTLYFLFKLSHFLATCSVVAFPSRPISLIIKLHTEYTGLELHRKYNRVSNLVSYCEMCNGKKTNLHAALAPFLLPSKSSSFSTRTLISLAVSGIETAKTSAIVRRVLLIQRIVISRLNKLNRGVTLINLM